MKSWLTKKDRLLAGTIIAGVSAFGFAGPVMAQEESDVASEEIIVTGSRIARPDLVSVSPLTAVGEDEVALTGTAAIENLMNFQPMVVSEFTQGVGNGATGAATVSLRGLGSNRTLVLIDGNRLMPGDPRVATPDLNNIPAALVERIDIISGGASAVYGSDAVAGVVNFRMRRDFEGVRVDAQHSYAWHTNDNAHMQETIGAFNSTAFPASVIPIPEDSTDAENYDFTTIFGVNTEDGRGNVTAYLSYRNIQPLSQGARDYGACSLSTVNSAPNLYDTHICQGSSNHAFGRFADFGPGGGVANNPDGSNTFVPTTGAMAFNFAPFNFYQQHDERYTAGFLAHYELNPHVEAYADLFFADDSQVSDAAPSGLFVNNGDVHSINCENPLMSPAQAAVICGPLAPNLAPNPDDPGGTLSNNLTVAYRFAGVPRVTRNDHTAYTMVTGARGELVEDWNYDFRLQYGHTSFRQVFTGDVSIARINDALNVVDLDPGPGVNLACASATARAAGCAPLDIFQALSAGITPEAVAYVGATAFQEGRTTEQIASLTFTGDLGAIGGKFPGAEDPIGLAFGAEYRREDLEFLVDSLFASGDLSGSGGVTPPASGTFDVFELFGETRIPIIQNQPLFHLLSLEAGYRYAEYSIAGEAEAYKLLGEWAPTEDIRLRGGYNRAVRAPNIVELFSPQAVGLGAFNDPCAGPAPPAGCINTFLVSGDPADLGSIPACPAAQCSQLLGSPTNPDDLSVEQADTYTVGIVFTPTFLPGFNFTVDWYNISIDKPIVAGRGGPLILSQCITNNLFCEFIHRDPNTGALFGISINDGYVINLNENLGSFETTGYDISAGYRLDFEDMGAEGMGSLSLHFAGTLVNEYVIEPVEAVGSYDCVGLFGVVCGTTTPASAPLPEWRHSLRATWESPWALTLSVNWRHIDEVGLDFLQDNPFLDVFPGVEVPIDAELPAIDYFDVAGTWDMTERFRLRAGINNVTDEDPPVVDANVFGISGPPFGNGNTFPGLYDTLGRTVFVGITADF